MDKPAIILCADARCGLKVGGLTILDRLIVTLHRAGCSPILVQAREPLPDLKRARALGIIWQTSESVAAPSADFLLSQGHLLIGSADVQRALLSGESLCDAEGREPLLCYLSAGAPVAVPVGLEGRALRPEGVARHVANIQEAQAAERAWWASLRSASDGTVDKYFNRPCGRLLSRVLVHTPITPNQISLASIAIGLVGAWFLASGDAARAVLGAFLFQLSAIVDCVDGDLARMLFKESRLGKWLDLAGDQVVHVAVFIGVGVGLARSGSTAPVGWLGASAVVGALISFGLVLRGMLAGGQKGTGKLQTLIDRATNRDFSVLVLLLAALNSLEWFLWMAAIGSHVFWMLLLLLQWNSPEPAAKRAESG